MITNEQRLLQLLLLERARRKDEYMAGILEWFIDVGIEVKESNLTGYVIIPIIDKNHWTDRSQWEENRTFLKPYAKEITEILNEIRKDVEPDVIEI